MHVGVLERNIPPEMDRYVFLEAKRDIHLTLRQLDVDLSCNRYHYNYITRIILGD